MEKIVHHFKRHPFPLPDAQSEGFLNGLQAVLPISVEIHNASELTVVGHLSKTVLKAFEENHLTSIEKLTVIE